MLEMFHRTINHRYDLSWKLQSISSFHRKFDVPCVKEISIALPCCEMRKNVFNLALSRHENVERKQSEVVSKSHCGTENCKRCQIEDIVALPRVFRLDFICKKLVWLISRNSLVQSKASFCVHSPFLAIPNARLKTFFLMRSVEISFMHGTSNFRWSPEIDPSFQLVSYLCFFVLWDVLCLNLTALAQPRPPHQQQTTMVVGVGHPHEIRNCPQHNTSMWHPTLHGSDTSTVENKTPQSLQAATINISKDNLSLLSVVEWHGKQRYNYLIQHLQRLRMDW